jgi:cell wall-associated NlpC family hydrolase
MLGGYVLDCAVQNRPPIKTLETIVKSPSSAAATLASTKGTAFVSTPTATATANKVSFLDALFPSSSTGTGTSTTSTGGAAATAVAYARAQIGKPYQWGATGPNSFDCSGLIQAAYKAAGISLTRTTYTQILQGSPVAKADLALGDLVFPDPSHVQIYSGNGNIVEAPHTGSNVREVAMWGFMAARRIVGSATTTGQVFT